MQNRIIRLILVGLAIGMPTLAQSPQFPKQTFTTSANGVVAFDIGTPYYYFGPSVTTLILNAAGLGTTASATLQMNVGPSALGPWTACGSAVTVGAGANASGSCSPTTGVYVQLVLASFNGVGSIARMHRDAERRRNIFYSSLVEHHHRPNDHNRYHPNNCRRV